MKWLSFILLVVLCLVACEEKDNSRPSNILPMEKMVQVMADIHIAEGVVSTKEFTKDSSLLLFNELENQLLEKRGVSRKEFEESFAWYTQHVTAYKELYTLVVDTLNVRTTSGKIQ
jgi:hypothetical protein